MQGQAIWRASQSRLDVARRLVSEMRVQLLSIDSARQNVDIHFNYIAKAHAEYGRQFAQQVCTPHPSCAFAPSRLCGRRHISPI